MWRVPEVANRFAKKDPNFCGAAVPEQPGLARSSTLASHLLRCRRKEIDARWYLPRGGSSLWNPQVEQHRRWLRCTRLRGHRPQRKSFYFGRFIRREKKKNIWNDTKWSSCVYRETRGEILTTFKERQPFHLGRSVAPTKIPTHPGAYTQGQACAD